MKRLMIVAAVLLAAACGQNDANTLEAKKKELQTEFRRQKKHYIKWF